jgi:hypothetical protein
MVVSGSYIVIVRYFPPGDDLVGEEVEFVFAYDANGAVVPPGTNATAPLTTTAAATLILAMTASMVATAYAAFGEELISVRFRRNTYSNR